ncbi:hypothetical protein U6G28_08995 [Actinomycetaceae bacterium MB13-C1-2]|nr:hypothetical protein U6G28_08995 [Actinomycetaceae bacterium MB13-C1-2]
MSKQGKTVDWDRVRDASADLCLAASNLSVRLSHTRPTEAPLAVEAERDQMVAEVLRLSDELREALKPRKPKKLKAPGKPRVGERVPAAVYVQDGKPVVATVE